ncbi:uncharacterized protein BJX67DRAFT_348226 [Aspergillus lucknowensis]|uniref:Hydrophobin n=1 Tax=Aspergillus lucknowensis TaxID=176173 RepID=A0ABR4LXV1_9EURO
MKFWLILLIFALSVGTVASGSTTMTIILVSTSYPKLDIFLLGLLIFLLSVDVFACDLNNGTLCVIPTSRGHMVAMALPTRV